MQVGCAQCGHALEFSQLPPRFCSNCGQPLAPESAKTQPYTTPTHTPYPFRAEVKPDAMPEVVAGYRLLRLIGSGGMGSVYEAEEIAGGRRVAIKLIRPEFANSSDAVERFRREGRLAGTIAHPRCVFVFAADEDAGRPYIVMELMPGENLHDRVVANGPLPVARAVTYILDAIEGLQEAHRHGLIHRDVKPSNCFLDAEGSVKVGDFGLAKSLMGGAALTKTGSFLGTVLFAAPEQIRNDPVDHQADVYSVAATLYFLLTGRAPFQLDDDPAATLARTMTDTPTPMPRLRRDVPGTLDAVVRRGLEKTPDKRWQGLQELRLALLPFVPGRHSLGEVGWRFGAYLIDLLLLVPLELAVLFVLRFFPHAGAPRGEVFLTFVVGLVCGVAYFAFPERLWGCSFGKFLLRLRVRTVRTNDRPGPLRALARTLGFFVLKDAGWLAVGMGVANGLAAMPNSSSGGLVFAVVLAGVLLPALGSAAGLLLMASTMRRRNGYRGLHEFLSGTKVIRLPAGHSLGRLLGHASSQRPTSRPDGLPERLGPFTVKSALRWTAGDKVLLAEDASLRREVWVWLRPAGGAPVSPRRREVVRPTRPRWLAHGRHGDLEWDAFVAPTGCLLADLANGRQHLGWPETLYLLQELSAELAAAVAEETLPRGLSPDRVWVQPTGRVQLLDLPLTDEAGAERIVVERPPDTRVQLLDRVTAEVPRTPAPDETPRVLALLCGAARLALEGRPAAPSGTPIRGPVPRHAALLLMRLAGVTEPFVTVAEFTKALEEAADKPTEVSRPRRLLHLALVGILLLPGLAWMAASVPLLTYGRFAPRFLLSLEAELVLQREEERAPENLAAALAYAEPWGRAALLVPTVSAAADCERLSRRLERLGQERQLLLASASWFTRRSLDRLHGDLKAKLEADKTLQWNTTGRPRGTYQAGMWKWTDVREIDAELEQAPSSSVIREEDVLTAALVLAVWPILWAVWAGVTRGGISMRLAGVALVQADGRRAARWRCIVRALLAWLPLLLLLGAALSLDWWRIGVGAALSPPQDVAWASVLAWLAWWLALGLPPLYAWLAQRSPGRGLHDRLAGTYLVPR